LAVGRNTAVEGTRNAVVVNDGWRVAWVGSRFLELWNEGKIPGGVVSNVPDLTDDELRTRRVIADDTTQPTPPSIRRKSENG
jgi:hypothetical protein